jgi:hypothetical protein
MRLYADRIGTAECTRHCLSSPHIMQFISSPTAQPRDVGKCESLGRSTVAGVDNEDVRAFSRVTSIVLRRRCYWGIGSRRERSSWTTNGAVLVECQ